MGLQMMGCANKSVQGRRASVNCPKRMGLRYTCVKEAASEKLVVLQRQQQNDDRRFAPLRLVHSGGPRELQLAQLLPRVCDLPRVCSCGSQQQLSRLVLHAWFTFDQHHHLKACLLICKYLLLLSRSGRVTLLRPKVLR